MIMAPEIDAREAHQGREASELTEAILFPVHDDDEAALPTDELVRAEVLEMAAVETLMKCSSVVDEAQPFAQDALGCRASS